MTVTQIMVVAGDPSGDANAADLVRALGEAMPGAQFFGAGGPKMAAAGVELAFDLTADAAIGVGGLLQKIPKLVRQRNALIRLAAERRAKLVLLVDYGGFNLSLAGALRRYLREGAAICYHWDPKIVQFVSPQVWASRPWRAKTIAQNYDLLLSIFPFEKGWYEKRAPELRVEFVGNPIFDRFPDRRASDALAEKEADPARIILLPGSRRGELTRHVPVLVEAAALIAARRPAKFILIVPNEAMKQWVDRWMTGHDISKIQIQVGGLAEALGSATLAITKSGTVNLECAFFGVPAITMYKADPVTYLIGRRIVTTPYLSMPNILADEAIYPELIQGEATPGRIAEAALELLAAPERRAEVRSKLAKVIRSLGSSGASQRAAEAIAKLFGAN